MKIIDKQRLVFSFYLTNDNLYNEINQFHLKFLSMYIHRFDEVVFCIIVENDVNKEVIIELQKIIISFNCRNVSFKIYPNTTYRESYVLYNEIATKLGVLDGLTFFGHNKGISDVFGKDNVKIWISLLYFFSFEVELPNNFMNGDLIYGPLKSVGCNYKFRHSITNRFDWTYCGTFFWMKCQEIDSYVKYWDIPIPELTNRWYSEMFPGNIICENESQCFDGIYLNGQEIVGAEIENIIDGLYDNHYILGEFKSYYDKHK